LKEHRAPSGRLRAAFSFQARGNFMSQGNGIDRVWRYKPTAESLGISTKTLQRLVARDEITTVQITDRIRGITESERARFIASRTKGAA
jgi:hypothetical protein